MCTARQFLHAALKLNPDGIDPNYLYGEFLFEEGEYAQAINSLRKALAAPPRPNREVADHGRRGEIEALLAKAQRKLGSDNEFFLCTAAHIAGEMSGIACDH